MTQQEKVDWLRNASLPSWERSLVESCQQRLSLRGYLTEAQVTMLDEIYTRERGKTK